MVVRDTLSMAANLLSAVDICEPFVSDTAAVQTPDYISTDDDMATATSPVNILVVGQDLTQTVVHDDHCSSNENGKPNEGGSQGLRILTSMRGNHLFNTRVDGARSEDDDGYCSRSSLDSPVQIMKQDNGISGGAEDTDVFQSRLDSASHSDGDLKRREHLDSCASSVTTSAVDEGGHATASTDYSSCDEAPVASQSGEEDETHAAAVTSLDHSYLLVTASDTNVNQPSGAESIVNASSNLVSVSEQTNTVALNRTAIVQPIATVLGGVTKSFSSKGRNFSVFVVPRSVQSVGATNQGEPRMVQVTPVASADCRSAEAAGIRWKGRSSCNIDSLKSSLRNTVKKELMNGELDRPAVSLSWHIADARLPSSAGTAAVQENVANNSLSSSENYLSLKSSLAHRPDQFKPGVSTGRCRISLSELTRRSPLGAVTHQKGATSARTGSMYVRTPQNARGLSSGGLLNRNAAAACRIGETTVRLHPLVDHDYGAFATFSAEIQSSIISTTTDGATQMDWRSVRKNRLGRIKNYRPDISVSVPSDQARPSSVAEAPPATVFQVRQKRKYCRRQPIIRDIVTPGVQKISKNVKIPGRKGRPPLSDSKRLSAAKKRSVLVDDVTSVTCNESQSYVKIPGCYQNEFVYYATKRTRGRPRKQNDQPSSLLNASVDSNAGATSKSSTPVGGINVFDWYREMAHTDKSSRFGTSLQSHASNSSTVHWTPVGSQQPSNDTGTPADESAVVDLVMEMLPKSELGMEKDFRSIPMSCGEDFSSVVDATPEYIIASDSRTELAVTEEDVCAAMIQSLNEADLKMIETQLIENGTNRLGSDMSLDSKALPDAAFSHYLTAEYGRDGLLSLSQASAASASNSLLDVDDINDSDLLSADLGNMNVLLNDFSTPPRDVRVNNIPAVSKSNLSALFDVSSSSDVANASSSLAKTSAVREVVKKVNVAVSSPPELTTVNMFWNDVPGLLIEGQEYVRLVEIHRQMLPAKDTGILKKRCQMLSLEVRQCSELQRDFLIRYMNAAKSKSTAIVSRLDAVELIGFYVNPKSRALRVDEADTPNIVSSTSVAPDKVELRPTAEISKQVAADLTLALVERATLPALTTSVQGSSTSSPPSTGVRSVDSTSVKRSERLRDKHVRYADMVLGIHHRHNSETETEHVLHEDTHSLSLSKPKRVADVDGAPLRVKFRRTGDDPRVHVDGGEYSRVQSSPEKDNGPRQTIVVQHSHCTRLASSCDDQLSPTTSPQTQLDCDSKADVRQQIQADTVKSELSFVESQKVVAKTREHVLTNRRNAILQRANKIHARRRGRFASSFSRRTTKVRNDATFKSATDGDNESFWQCEKSSAMLTSVCEDLKENLSVEGHVADNTDVNRLKRDLVEVSTTDSADRIIEDDGRRNETPTACVGVVSSTGTTVSCQFDAVDSKLHHLCSRVDEMPQSELKVKIGRPVVGANAIQVRHSDVMSRFGRRRRSQNGTILLDKLTWSGANCVCCDSCGSLLSIASFAAHMHRGSSAHLLVPVDALQRLEPRGLKGEEWQYFERLLATFSANSSSSCDAASSVDKRLTAATMDWSESLGLPPPHEVVVEPPVVCSPIVSAADDDDVLNMPTTPSSHLAVVGAADNSCTPRRMTRSVDTSHADKLELSARRPGVVNTTMVHSSNYGRNTRSTDDTPSKLNRGVSEASVKMTPTACGRHRPRGSPLGDVKHDADTRSGGNVGLLRQNYRLRSPPGATAPK